MESKLERVQMVIRELTPGHESDGRETPHKLVLLLAVLDMADDDPALSEKLIYLTDDRMKERFAKQFHIHDKEHRYSNPNPSEPFKRLKCSLWDPQKEMNGKWYVRLGGDLRDVIQKKTDRDELREFIEGELKRKGWPA